MTWGEIAARSNDLPDVTVVRGTVLDRRVWLVRISVVVVLIVAVVDGAVCGYCSEASQPVESPLTLWFGPTAARAKLRSLLGL